MAKTLFHQVTIIGVGLLGASLGMALRRRKLAQRVVGVGRTGSVSIATALERGAIDAAAEIADGVAGADLVVLCTPVRQFPGMMEVMGPHLKKGAIVTDVGSTKGDVMRWAAEHLPMGAVFVGCHPMAGSEKSGPGAAREDLYEGGVCLITTESRAGRVGAAARKLDAMWRGVGMRTHFITPAEHDGWVALVSHLPFATAGCLVRSTAGRPEALEAAAGGFVDSTRVASGDGDMWTDIFMTNRKAIVEVIGWFEKEMAGLKKAVAAGNEAEIRKRFAASKVMRDAVMAERAMREKR